MPDPAPAPAAASTFSDFARVIDHAVYRPLPEDWWIGATDVVGSTEAIARGRYKSVNMAGASAISAIMNALGGATFPFAFGGDGAILALAHEHRDEAARALARTARWSIERLGLELRAALIPLGDIRKAGHDVLVAHFAPSPAVSYAMFAGGGVEWADEQMKSGRYAVAPAPSGSRPDLSGLSCRWKPIAARNGVMLSVIVRRAPGVGEDDFSAAIDAAVSLMDGGRGRPVPASGPDFGPPWAGFELEASATAPDPAPPWFRLKLLTWRSFAWLVVKSGLTVAGFNGDRYRRQTALNSDFRKFQDGLNMTIDCTDEEARRIEAALDRFRRQGVIRFGTFRQSDALMTCIVPSYSHDGHFHFIDGAGGGYAEAARVMKQSIAKGRRHP